MWVCVLQMLPFATFTTCFGQISSRDLCVMVLVSLWIQCLVLVLPWSPISHTWAPASTCQLQPITHQLSMNGWWRWSARASLVHVSVPPLLFGLMCSSPASSLVSAPPLESVQPTWVSVSIWVFSAFWLPFGFLLLSITCINILINSFHGLKHVTPTCLLHHLHFVYYLKGQTVTSLQLKCLKDSSERLGWLRDNCP